MTHPTTLAAVGIVDFVNQWFEQHRNEVLQWRRHIHRYPETSNQEFGTTAFIMEILQRWRLRPIAFPETGLMVDIGPDSPAGRLAFRASIDALPIQEVTG